jgi:PhzF family phenazine biosynthesis protein
MTRAYTVVDVFTSTPLLGNPVAVVLDTEGLETEQMQAIARWTNLSETTFLLPSTEDGADYRLRIFTPRSELPFAGHPTLGGAHAALAAGRARARTGRLVQQCGVGLVDIAVDGTGREQVLTLSLPSGRLTALAAEDVSELEAALGHPLVTSTPPAIVDVGVVWIVAEVESPEALLALAPDMTRGASLDRRLGVTGVSLFARYPDGGREVRSFAPSCGVDEDPVCGSGNGSIALFQVDRGLLAPGDTYVARQGRCVGRDGQVRITVRPDGEVGVGGSAVTVATGVLNV